MATTRTVGPLHLEDLEPHRFEDLIRQLLYDFRPWLSLEATGRSGADEGFDARGTEITRRVRIDWDRSEDDEQEAEVVSERVWLVQCKRERAIGPQKLVGYMDDIVGASELYGIVFAAACDFSKTARDRFREKARQLGFDEAHLWGKAEIEDQLFQPKNDHLLFAYFGVSLQIRRRTLKTAVRAKLATKRKALRVLSERARQSILLRDSTDDRYPWMEEDETKMLEERRRWAVMTYKGAFSNGLHFIVDQHPAYVGDDGEEWDFAEKFNSGPVPDHENPWKISSAIPDEIRIETFKIWNALPQTNKFWFLVYAVLPFENILDIDENGDEWFEGPHIYTTEFHIKLGPFRGFIETLERNHRIGGLSQIEKAIAKLDGNDVYPDAATRVQKFPRRVA